MMTQQTTHGSEKKLTMPVVHATKDYARFKLLPGNRNIYVNHVNELTKDIANRNLLHANPLLVNKDMAIIDGQHRLEVAKNNDLTIYYMIIDEADLALVQELNASQKSWTAMDYLHSYAALGNEHYIFLEEMMAKYAGIKINTLLNLISTSGGRNYNAFKHGTFIVQDQEEVILHIEAYMKIKPYIVGPAWRDREFVLSFVKVLEVKPVEELIAKFETSNWTIERQVSQKDYLREFERVINYRKQNTERLF